MGNEIKNNGNPTGVTMGDEVDRTRISATAIIHPGCKLFGSKTLICKGAELGYEAPVTIKDCYIGPNVKLKGGYFEGAVFLAGAEAGSGAHVRAGTILDEQASVAHTVGLKHTILLPFVTLGSLINFCDCLMAGGTSRKNHSEVGSSYIHFNFTPNQDKATSSLIGEVPHGVMLDQNPIFLGGQGGLVGPCRIAYGTIIAAGSIYRKDQLKPDRLVFEGGGRGGSVPYSAGIYRNVKRQVLNNVIYIANLVALMAWTIHIRRLFIGEPFPQRLYDGLTGTLELAIDERINRFVAFCEKLKESKQRYQQQMSDSASVKLLQQKDELYNRREQVNDLIHGYLDKIYSTVEPSFSETIEKYISTFGSDYLHVIKNLKEADRRSGTKWLQQIVDDVSHIMLDLFPSIR